ncbi:putative diamine N-acetyltransferase transcription regulator GNAT family [Helianthus anomalus]
MNPSSPPTTTTITLRPFRLSDANDLLQFAGDEQVTRFLRWETLKTTDEALTFIKDKCIPHRWRRSICIDDRSIGFISTFYEDGHKADIGYGLAAKYWGRGIATEAVKMAVKQVLMEFPDIVRLQAFTDVENVGSRRVLEKAGFKLEGLLRKYTMIKGCVKDTLVFSLLSTDEI